MLDKQQRSLAFRRIEQVLRCDTEGVSIELLSGLGAAQEALVSIEMFDKDGVFKGVIEVEIPFDKLNVDFLISHGTEEDLGLILRECQRLARTTIYADEVGGAYPKEWEPYLVAIKDSLGRQWVVEEICSE